MGQPLWNTVWKFLRKVTHRVTMWPSQSGSGVYPKRNEKISLHKDSYLTIHRSIIYKSPTVETAQMYVS